MIEVYRMGTGSRLFDSPCGGTITVARRMLMPKRKKKMCFLATAPPPKNYKYKKKIKVVCLGSIDPTFHLLISLLSDDSYELQSKESLRKQSNI